MLERSKQLSELETFETLGARMHSVGYSLKKVRGV